MTSDDGDNVKGSWKIIIFHAWIECRLFSMHSERHLKGMEYETHILTNVQRLASLIKLWLFLLPNAVNLHQQTSHFGKFWQKSQKEKKLPNMKASIDFSATVKLCAEIIEFLMSGAAKSSSSPSILCFWQQSGALLPTLGTIYHIKFFYKCLIEREMLKSNMVTEKDGIWDM